MNNDVEIYALEILNIVSPVYICIPQMRHALLCPMWQHRFRTLCPHQASNTCGNNEQLINVFHLNV